MREKDDLGSGMETTGSFSRRRTVFLALEASLTMNGRGKLVWMDALAQKAASRGCGKVSCLALQKREKLEEG